MYVYYTLLSIITKFSSKLEVVEREDILNENAQRMKNGLPFEIIVSNRVTVERSVT